MASFGNTKLRERRPSREQTGARKAIWRRKPASGWHHWRPGNRVARKAEAREKSRRCVLADARAAVGLAAQSRITSGWHRTLLRLRTVKTLASDRQRWLNTPVMGEVQMETGGSIWHRKTAMKRAYPCAAAQFKPSHVLRGRVFLWLSLSAGRSAGQGRAPGPNQTAQAAGPCLHSRWSLRPLPGWQMEELFRAELSSIDEFQRWNPKMNLKLVVMTYQEWSA